MLHFVFLIFKHPYFQHYILISSIPQNVKELPIENWGEDKGRNWRQGTFETSASLTISMRRKDPSQNQL
jgi:hypothetical protein